jgi:signal transduction histidine kinase
MLERARKHAPEGSPLKADLREIAEVAQTMLTQVRSLSQTLHPSILEQAGLEGTIDWYLSTVERQTGLSVSYERDGPAIALDGTTAIHVYRVMQEALNNVARHAGVKEAWVRLRSKNDMIELDVEDHGRGTGAGASQRGLGIVAMRERAEMLGGAIEFLEPAGGGTLVRLRVPIEGKDAYGE